MIEYLPALKLTAKLSTALFAGSSLYSSFVEHPAMLKTDTKSAVDHFNAMFKRAGATKALTSLAGAASGLLIYHLSKEEAYLYSGLLMLSLTPYTILFIRPTNKVLLDPQNDKESEYTKRLLKRWGRLNSVRTVIGISALVINLHAS